MSSKDSRLAVVNPCKYATVGKVHLLGGFNQNYHRRLECAARQDSSDLHGSQSGVPGCRFLNPRDLGLAFLVFLSADARGFLWR